MEKTVLNALNSEFDKLSKEEKKARLDIGYKQTVGKHVVVELKKSGRVVKTGELTQQVMKYHDALKKVLNSSGKTNEPFEIICVLGKPIDNDGSQEHFKSVANSLKAWDARIVYYTELIENAYKAYSAYLNENKEAQPLIEMFQQLEEEMD